MSDGGLSDTPRLFDGEAGKQITDTIFEWPCGCIAHSYEREMVVKACCEEHDDPLDDFVTATALAANPAMEIERKYV